MFFDTDLRYCPEDEVNSKRKKYLNVVKKDIKKDLKI